MAGTKKSQSVSKSKQPKPFSWSDSLIEAVQKRANGHAKVGSLLARIISERYERGSSMKFLNELAQLGFYGEDIWYGFENYCRSDIGYFVAVIEIKEKGFYDFILDYKAHQALKALKGKD
jgi:hypothetical protein